MSCLHEFEQNLLYFFLDPQPDFPARYLYILVLVLRIHLYKALPSLMKLTPFIDNEIVLNGTLST